MLAARRYILRIYFVLKKCVEIFRFRRATLEGAFSEAAEVGWLGRPNTTLDPKVIWREGRNRRYRGNQENSVPVSVSSYKITQTRRAKAWGFALRGHPQIQTTMAQSWGDVPSLVCYEIQHEIFPLGSFVKPPSSMEFSACSQ